MIFFYIFLAVVVVLAALGCFYPTGGNLKTSPLINLSWRRYPAQALPDRPGSPVPLPIAARLDQLPMTPADRRQFEARSSMHTLTQRLLRETEAALEEKLVQPQRRSADFDLRHVVHQAQAEPDAPNSPNAPLSDTQPISVRAILTAQALARPYANLRSRTRGGAYRRLPDGPGDDSSK